MAWPKEEVASAMTVHAGGARTVAQTGPGSCLLETIAVIKEKRSEPLWGAH